MTIFPLTGKRFRGWLRLGLCAAAALFGVWAIACSKKTTGDWPAIKRMVRDKFPDVPQMTTSDLSRHLAADARPPILLDARSDEEYAVSHLPNARLATSEQQGLAALADAGKDQLIVAYCSVGYRSSALAEKLIKRGYTNVHNLEGSIFEWANEGRPVVQDERQVKAVHPYDKTWGGLLNRDLWCFSPEAAK